jgi:hypothetical protein
MQRQIDRSLGMNEGRNALPAWVVAAARRFGVHTYSQARAFPLNLPLMTATGITVAEAPGLQDAAIARAHVRARFLARDRDQE